MIKWLFFDLGSTLVDESACDEYRFRQMLAQPGAPDRDVLEQKMHGYAQKGMHPYKSVLKEFALEACPWPSELERLYAGVSELLEALHQKYRLGIIANQLPGTDKRLEKYGIRGYFDVIVASAEADCAKPDAEIFRIALENAGCRPDEACMIGDRPDNDIVPAARLGMHTIRVKQGMFRFSCPDSSGNIPEYMVTDICDLTGILL